MADEDTTSDFLHSNTDIFISEEESKKRNILIAEEAEVLVANHSRAGSEEGEDILDDGKLKQT